MVRPFVGLRPSPERAAEVAAPPYDVVSSDQARRLARDRPWSFLHVSRAEIDLPPGTDPHAPEVYAKGAENLRRMIEAGVLRRDAGAYYYVYRLTQGDHVQTGLVAGVPVRAYEAKRIRPHEATQPEKEEDRLRHIETLKAQTGPVMVVHRPIPDGAALLARIVVRPPAYAFAAADGVGHALWVVSDPRSIEDLTGAFRALDALYIADGHHRSAAAVRVARKSRTAKPRLTGEAAHEYFLAVAFPSDEVRILDYNRAVRDLNGLTAQAFIEEVKSRFAVEASRSPLRPTRPREFGMYLEGHWYRLLWRGRPASEPNAAARLDASLLSAHLLEPVLGIGDPRLDPRIGFIGGTCGLEELKRRVDGGEMAVAFTICPPRVEDVMAVADAGEMMPPKSTWFEPKLADGLVSYPLD